jgi:ABC-type uncharacterized transport system fused permease/ATPase subunit
LLLNKPKYAILDEATSALDLGNEERLYQHLQAKGTTFLSVGHRSTLANYHQSLLELSQDKTWQIKATSGSCRRTTGVVGTSIEYLILWGERRKPPIFAKIPDPGK